jgi:hypothetical protein
VDEKVMAYRALWLAVWLSIASVVPAAAHHPLSDFDLDSVRVLDGILFELRLVNPHSMLTLDVRDRDGRSEKWTVEWGPALLLKRQGVTTGTLAVGDHLVVTGFAAVDPAAHKIRLRTIRRPTDGWTWTGGFDF